MLKGQPSDCTRRAASLQAAAAISAEMCVCVCVGLCGALQYGTHAMIFELGHLQGSWLQAPASRATVRSPELHAYLPELHAAYQAVCV